MAKNTNRAASAIAYVAALVLATGAWAAHWEMYVKNPVTYAKEVFGGDDPTAGGVTLKEDVTDTDRLITKGRTLMSFSICPTIIL